MTAEEECIQALGRAAERIGHSPTKAEYEQLGLTPASGTIQRVMGSWNAAKEAAGLETDYSRGPRVAEKPDHVTLPDGTEWADLSRNQRWHYRNVEHNTQRSLDRRAKQRGFVYLLKREAGGCMRCGESDPACLDFHHRRDVEKEMNVSKLISYGHARERLLEEIEKCEILCANCHRKEHYEPPECLGDIDTEAVRSALDRLSSASDGSSQH